MWSSVTCMPCCSRSAPISFVTLASATVAGVMHTARMKPVSKSWSTWRMSPSTRTLRLLRQCRVSTSSTLMRRSLATPLIRLAFPLSSMWTSCSFTGLGNLHERLSQDRFFLVPCLHPGLYHLQYVQDQAPCFFSLPSLVPIPIKSRLQACRTHHVGSRLRGDLDQLPPRHDRPPHA